MLWLDAQTSASFTKERITFTDARISGRPIFGQVRDLSGASTGKKFDSKKCMAQNLQAGMLAD
jgi:hypothetical protein